MLNDVYTIQNLLPLICQHKPNNHTTNTTTHRYSRGLEGLLGRSKNWGRASWRRHMALWWSGNVDKGYVVWTMNVWLTLRQGQLKSNLKYGRLLVTFWRMCWHCWLSYVTKKWAITYDVTRTNDELGKQPIILQSKNDDKMIKMLCITVVIIESRKLLIIINYKCIHNWCVTCGAGGQP